jgi:hypothetical protein
LLSWVFHRPVEIALNDVRAEVRPDVENPDVCFRGDSVAKVVLPKVSKILRAVGAIFV